MNAIPNQTLTMDEPTAAGRPTRSAARRRLGRGTTILAALVVAVLDWLVCAQVFGMDLMVDQGAGPTEVKPALVAAAPIVSGLAGWALLAILERLSPRRGTAIWTIVAIIVAVLSCFSPITAALSGATAVALTSMHVLVGAALIIGLRRR